jgi:hypothetical protein
MVPYLVIHKYHHLKSYFEISKKNKKNKDGWRLNRDWRVLVVIKRDKL